VSHSYYSTVFVVVVAFFSSLSPLSLSFSLSHSATHHTQQSQHCSNCTTAPASACRQEKGQKK